jgi:hypothetical protein
MLYPSSKRIPICTHPRVKKRKEEKAGTRERGHTLL